MKRQLLYLALLAAAALPALPARAASADLPDDETLQAYLHGRYFEIEFFVFERPAVLDFATEEILTLTRARALPRELRTQVLPADALWTSPIDALTRACLTYPTLTWALVPEEPLEAMTPEEAPLLTPLPVPEIHPELAPDPELDFLAGMAAFESSLIESSQRWQAPERFQLRREAARIERRGVGRILFHGRWLQAVPPREQPDPILVTGGASLTPPQPPHELIGSVGVTLGRYLHFRAELFFHGPALGLLPASAPMGMTGDPTVLIPDQVEAGYMVLSESRRMRSEELHYLDHPKLGLVVRIDPVRIPEALVEAYVALEEDVE